MLATAVAPDDVQHLNIAATIFSPSPTHFCCTAPIRTLMNVAPDSFAMAWFYGWRASRSASGEARRRRQEEGPK